MSFLSLDREQCPDPCTNANGQCSDECHLGECSCPDGLELWVSSGLKPDGKLCVGPAGKDYKPYGLYPISQQYNMQFTGREFAVHFSEKCIEIDSWSFTHVFFIVDDACGIMGRKCHKTYNFCKCHNFLKAIFQISTFWNARTS